MEEQKTDTCPKTSITLTKDQQEMLIDCGALHYNEKMISNLLRVSVADAKRIIEESNFRDHYEHGKALAQYRVDSKLLELASQGDMKAMKELRRIQRTND